MNPAAGKILRLGLLAAIALIVLQIVWHAWIAPPRATLLWPGLALAVAPLLPGLWVARESLRRSVLICGIVSLFYFSHGVAELWSGNAPHWLALAEILFTLVIIGASGWDARGYKRAKKSATAADSRAGSASA